LLEKYKPAKEGAIFKVIRSEDINEEAMDGEDPHS
jgi:hypothetical protein